MFVDAPLVSPVATPSLSVFAVAVIRSHYLYVDYLTAFDSFLSAANRRHGG